MKATGMSAKQMDSNAELKLYLATATDPTLDVATNKRALDMILSLYGGGNVKPADTAKPPPLQRGGIVDGYRFKGGDPANKANWEPVK
jgi:hypothetical protein